MRVASVDNFQYKPGWVKLVDSTLNLANAKSSLDFDSLIKKARNKSGKTDLGDFYDEPLRVLLNSIEKEANLSMIGRFMMQQRLINLLIVRLNAEYWFKKHPEILDTQVYPLWLIAGLQRTGTTKLQRLLAADPENRSLLSWEALNPAPLHENWKSKDNRPSKGKLSQNALKLISPSFFAIHPIEYEAPEEDILLLDVSFMSTTAEATMHVPSYASWIEKTDNQPAYEYESKLLKLLQWQNPASRWVLKSPHHLEHLGTIKKVYNDVRIIWPHRDIKECIPSFISMMAHSFVMFSNTVSFDQVKKQWLRKIQYMLDRAIEFRINNPELFTDLHYDDLVRDSARVIEDKIYQRPLSNAHSMRLGDMEKQNPKGKYGKHLYSFESLGLSIEEFESVYKNYLKLYSELKNGEQ